MSAVRTLLALAGLSLGAYGAVLLYDNPPLILVRIAVWAAAGVLLHDFVFAPVCAAMGWAAGRVLPRRLQVPIGVAALCVVVLGLLAVPVYDKPGQRPDNATVLDRDRCTSHRSPCACPPPPRIALATAAAAPPSRSAARTTALS